MGGLLAAEYLKFAAKHDQTSSAPKIVSLIAYDTPVRKILLFISIDSSKSTYIVPWPPPGSRAHDRCHAATLFLGAAFTGAKYFVNRWKTVRAEKGLEDNVDGKERNKASRTSAGFLPEALLTTISGIIASYVAITSDLFAKYVEAILSVVGYHIPVR